MCKVDQKSSPSLSSTIFSLFMKKEFVPTIGRKAVSIQNMFQLSQKNCLKNEAHKVGLASARLPSVPFLIHSSGKGTDMVGTPLEMETLPEAQQTQGIESVTWIHFWARLIFSMAVSWRIVSTGIKTEESSAAICAHSAYISLPILTKLKHSETKNILHHSQAWSISIFGWNPEIWLKSWNLVEIQKFCWNPKIY